MQHFIERARTKNWIGFGARAALLLVGAIWGSSLVVVKSAAEYISPNFLIALRFTAAFAVLALIGGGCAAYPARFWAAAP